MTDKSQQFASDNYSGICPEAWAAMAKANPVLPLAVGPAMARARDVMGWVQQAPLGPLVPRPFFSTMVFCELQNCRSKPRKPTKA